MNKRIKISIIVFFLVITSILSITYFNIFYKESKVKKLEINEKVISVDTVYVDRIIEKKVYIPKYIIQIEKDTVEVVNKVYVDKPVEVIKEVYVDREIESSVKVPVRENKLFLGFGYQYDLQNYFSGANIKIINQTRKDKMFSLDIGFRNDLLNTESGVSKLRPYVGGSIYFRIDN